MKGAAVRRLATAMAGGLIGVTMLAACTRTDGGPGQQSPSATSPPASQASTQSPTSPTPPLSASPSSTTTPATPLPAGFSTAPKKGGTAPARASLLRVIRSGSHYGFDRIVFEFSGPASAHDVRYVDQVRSDPSDRPVALRGNAYLSVVMPGGTLDTSLQVDDPARARSYKGPRRIQPDLPAVKEIAVAGDFEAVLSFGIGLDSRTAFRVIRLTEPGRVVLDVATA